MLNEKKPVKTLEEVCWSDGVKMIADFGMWIWDLREKMNVQHTTFNIERSIKK
jgi:hypothetical protein